ncbi:MAG TPA: hypothetical protein DCY20_06135 [Firmicutes bacterium]|nr:hypothetical protein [Bacillota bacterium]
MLIYWKPGTNQVLEQGNYDQVVLEATRKIQKWGETELHLQNDFLEQFIQEKTNEFAGSYLKLKLPYQTLEECRGHIDTFNAQYGDVVTIFPYDRWVWRQRLETIQYSDYDYDGVTIINTLVDQKDHKTSTFEFMN